MYPAINAQYYNHPMMDGSWGFGMMFFWLIFLVLIVVAMVYLLRGQANPPGGSSEHREPIEIARERYAKGEIKKEEFEQIKKDLAAR